MVNHSVPHGPLPCRAHRSKIVEQAKLVLAEAQALAEQLDGSIACLPNRLLKARTLPSPSLLPPGRQVFLPQINYN
jgi:hypothetical protein